MERIKALPNEDFFIGQKAGTRDRAEVPPCFMGCRPGFQGPVADQDRKLVFIFEGQLSQLKLKDVSERLSKAMMGPGGSDAE